jgi:hypothetical protein
MMADAIEYENRALATIKLHLPELPEREKPAAFQLRFPAFDGCDQAALARVAGGREAGDLRRDAGRSRLLPRPSVQDHDDQGNRPPLSAWTLCASESGHESHRDHA